MKPVQVFDGDGVRMPELIRLSSSMLNNLSGRDSYQFQWARGKRQPKFSFDGLCHSLLFTHTLEALAAFRRCWQCAVDGIPFDIEFTTDVSHQSPGFPPVTRTVGPMRRQGIVHFGSLEHGTVFLIVADFHEAVATHAIAGKQPLPTRGLSADVWDRV